DPRLVYTATKDGRYVVRLFAFPSIPDATIEFRGGPDYLYRLTVTTGPFISHAVPLSVSQADLRAVRVFGWNVPPNAQLPVIPMGGELFNDHQELETQGDRRTLADARFGIVYASGFAGSARVRLAPHSVTPGIAKTDADRPFTLKLPSAATGWLRSPG